MVRQQADTGRYAYHTVLAELSPANITKCQEETHKQTNSPGGDR